MLITHIDEEKYPVSLLFPEQELVMEQEKCDAKPTEEKTEEEKLAEYKKYMKGTTDGASSQKLSEKDLQDMAKAETKKDKQFNAFKKRVDHEPEQVCKLANKYAISNFKLTGRLRFPNFNNLLIF